MRFTELDAASAVTRLKLGPRTEQTMNLRQVSWPAA